MHLILSTTFDTLPKEQQQTLMDESVTFYYPDQEEIVTVNPEMRRNIEMTLRRLKELT